MEPDRLTESFGKPYIGEAKIDLPSSQLEDSSQLDIDGIATEALRQMLFLIGSGADELTDTGYTYRELHEALNRLNP